MMSDALQLPCLVPGLRKHLHPFRQMLVDRPELKNQTKSCTSKNLTLSLSFKSYQIAQQYLFKPHPNHVLKCPFFLVFQPISLKSLGTGRSNCSRQQLKNNNTNKAPKVNVGLPCLHMTAFQPENLFDKQALGLTFNKFSCFHSNCQFCTWVLKLFTYS